MMVVIKLIAPRVDEISTKGNKKIARSTESSIFAKFFERVGNTVHPVPILLSTAADDKNNLVLFIGGKALSRTPN